MSKPRTEQLKIQKKISEPQHYHLRYGKMSTVYFAMVDLIVQLFSRDLRTKWQMERAIPKTAAAGL